MPLAADRILFYGLDGSIAFSQAELFRTREGVSDPFLILLGLAIHN